MTCRTSRKSTRRYAKRLSRLMLPETVAELRKEERRKAAQAAQVAQAAPPARPASDKPVRRRVTVADYRRMGLLFAVTNPTAHPGDDRDARMVRYWLAKQRSREPAIVKQQKSRRTAA